MTIDGIAHGFGLQVVRHPDIERRMRQRLGADVNEARLRMANVPEGAELLATEALFAPVVKIHNVFIFPGIPRRFCRSAFTPSKRIFARRLIFLRIVYVKLGEGIIAKMLNDVLAQFPELLLGSYPVLEVPEYKVKVTFESKGPRIPSARVAKFSLLAP